MADGQGCKGSGHQGRSAARHPQPAHRGHRLSARRGSAHDHHRRQRLADAQPRQGARPHRRIGRRQVDHRPVVDGLWPRRRAHHRRRGDHQRPRHPQGRHERTAQAARSRSLLCGAVGGGRLQPGPQADGPGGRGDAAAWRRQPGRGREARGQPVPQAQPPGSREHRQPFPASGLRRPAAARHDRHGAVLGARPDRLRRADHRARRHHPDRRARRHQGRHPRHRRRRALHHPRPRRRRPGLGRDHGAAPRQAGRMGRHAPDHQGATPGIHQRARLGASHRA